MPMSSLPVEAQPPQSRPKPIMMTHVPSDIIQTRSSFKLLGGRFLARTIRDSVKENDWTKAFKACKDSPLIIMDVDDQKMVWRKAMENKDVKNRSHTLFSSLRDVHFPTKFVDVALEEVLRNGDWDMVYEICSFSAQRPELPPYPHSLPQGTKIRMIQLLRNSEAPGADGILEEATKSVFYYSKLSASFSDNVAKTCVVLFIDHVSSPKERAHMLWETLLRHPVFLETANYLQEISFQRACQTVRELQKMAMDYDPWNGENRLWNYRSLCHMLLDSGVLGRDQTHQIYEKLERIRAKEIMERRQEGGREE